MWDMPWSQVLLEGAPEARLEAAQGGLQTTGRRRPQASQVYRDEGRRRVSQEEDSWSSTVFPSNPDVGFAGPFHHGWAVHGLSAKFAKATHDELVAHLVTNAKYLASLEVEGSVLNLWLGFEYDPAGDKSPDKSDLRKQFTWSDCSVLSHRDFMMMAAAFPMYRGEVNQAKPLSELRPWHKKAWDKRKDNIGFAIGIMFTYAATHTFLVMDFLSFRKDRSMVTLPTAVTKDRNAWKFALRDGLRGPPPTIININSRPYLVTPTEKAAFLELRGKFVDEELGAGTWDQIFSDAHASNNASIAGRPAPVPKIDPDVCRKVLPSVDERVRLEFLRRR